MYALISANLVNAAGNSVFIYGHLGMPALGVTGSAWSTTGARIYVAAFLYIAIRRAHRAAARDGEQMHVSFDRARVARLVRIGFPAASQVALEVGVFAAATAMAGKLDPTIDGTQAVATGILRGLGETRMPMIVGDRAVDRPVDRARAHGSCADDRMVA